MKQLMIQNIPHHLSNMVDTESLVCNVDATADKCVRMQLEEHRDTVYSMRLTGCCFILQMDSKEIGYLSMVKSVI